jgi:hypothetical protein
LFLCLLALDRKKLDLDVLAVGVLKGISLVKVTARDGRDAVKRVVSMSVVVGVVYLGIVFFLFLLFLHPHEFLDDPRYVCKDIGVNLIVVIRGHCR